MKMCPKLKNPHFSCIFFNMDISLDITPICLKTCMQVAWREACLKILI